MSNFIDLKILAKFEGDEIEFMKFDVELSSLFRKYDIIWKETTYIEEQFTADELKR